MLAIGEFSKICEVSTKTLRYYAETGLITPDEVNLENGYRYYSIEQLKTMLLINRLKSQHFSLEEIKLIIEEDDKDNALYAFLSKKKRDIQDSMKSLDATLQLICDDMLRLENGNSVMSYLDGIDVELVDVPKMNILYFRKVLSIEECSKGYAGIFGKLMLKISQLNLSFICGKPAHMAESRIFHLWKI